VHDLKNLVSQLSLLVLNAQRHRGNPAFQADMLETLDHAVEKMRLMLQRLAQAPQAGAAVPLRLDQLLERMVRARAGLAPRPRLAGAAPGLSVLADRDSLERVLGHLLQNAVEATAPDGSVTLRLLRQGEAAVLELRDSGAGMSAEFIRERLFRPFDSTKASGMGVGAFESREYIRSLGGQLEVHSRPGGGTTFRIILPLASAAAAAA
jgi:putative PEP-CTERM system histidine kinase